MNWRYIENGTRDFVRARNFSDAVVYTGTSGICQLADVNGDKVDIYLYTKNGARQLPVPRFYWKVIADFYNGAGVAIIGVNNPHITENEIDHYRICNPLKDHPIMKGISQPDNITKGVVYACNVSDALKVIDEIPKGLAKLHLLS